MRVAFTTCRGRCNKIANWLEDPLAIHSLSKFCNLKRNQLSITPSGKKQATIYYLVVAKQPREIILIMVINKGYMNHE